MDGTGLLLALDDELQVDRQRLPRLQERFHSSGVHADVALVVGRTAGEHPSFLDHRDERRRLPEIDGIHGLDVVVRIHQDGGLARRMQPIRVNQRMTSRLADLDVFHARRPQVGRDEFGCRAAVGCVLLQRRNAGNPKQRLERLQPRILRVVEETAHDFIDDRFGHWVRHRTLQLGLGPILARRSRK